MKKVWRNALLLQGIVDRSILDGQLAAQQPSWLNLSIPFALFLSLVWLLRFTISLLPYKFQASSYSDLVCLLLMTVIIVFITSHSFLMNKKYRLSISSSRSLIKIIAVGFAMSLPLVLINLYYYKNLINSLDTFVHSDITKQEFREALSKVHNRLWNPLGWGVGYLGIGLASMTCFISPIYEELMLSGFTATKLAKHFKIAIVIIIHALIFAAIHILFTGLTHSIFMMLISGGVYLTARFISGSWLSALAAHWLVNFVILLPRWYVAILFFRLYPSGSPDY